MSVARRGCDKVKAQSSVTIPPWRLDESSRSDMPPSFDISETREEAGIVLYLEDGYVGWPSCRACFGMSRLRCADDDPASSASGGLVPPNIRVIFMLKSVTPSARRANSWRARLTLPLAILVLLVAWNKRESVLSSMARSWSVSDELAPADAVAVFGGGDDRAHAAVQFYRSGLARRILLDDDYDRELVINLNVPPQAVEMFGSGLSNTYEEACALARWAEKNGARRIVIPTELFPSRRLNWIASREFNLLGDKIMVVVLPTSEYRADDWWISKSGWDQFETEVAKYVYYRIRYSSGPCLVRASPRAD